MIKYYEVIEICRKTLPKDNKTKAITLRIVGIGLGRIVLYGVIKAKF